MNIEPLVSVIVPVYNVKDYIERCVKSIIMQTYKNLEIILVDDGSSDCSGELCDRLEKEDKRVKVIHQSNKGLAGARNTGIDVSKGEFICFVDSDDYVHPDYIKYLHKLCVDNECEIALCGYYPTDKVEIYQNVDWNKAATVYSRKQIFDVFYSDMHVPIVIAWNKMYSRKCVGNIRYDVGFIHEDEATTFKYLYNAEKVVVGSEKLYYYFDRANSITGKRYNKKRLDILKAYENRIDFYLLHNEKEYYDRECQFYLSEILNNYYKVFCFLDKDKELLKELMGKYRDIYKKSDKSKWRSSRKMLYIICNYFPLLYGAIKHGKS